MEVLVRDNVSDAKHNADAYGLTADYLFVGAQRCSERLQETLARPFPPWDQRSDRPQVFEPIRILNLMSIYCGCTR